MVIFDGVASTAVTALERKGNHLVMKYAVSDQLTVEDYFHTAYPGCKVEQFKFSDGVIWDEASIKSRVITNGNADADSITGYQDGTNRIFGMDGNDYLTGGRWADIINGGIGDDTLKGDAGDDTLIGGAGNDTLEGGADADTLDGGIGNDTLKGGSGNDTYKLAAGSGVDVIDDYDTTTGNVDVVIFDGVASTAVTALERKGNHLVMKYAVSDQLTVEDYFHTAYPGSKVEHFKFSDGVTWDEVLIKSRVITNGNADADSITGYQDGTNRIFGMDGNDYLTG
ncbi:calcium-binding protein, partial [Variovorax sp. H27-G14]|uniref:calcium-binding protein n=1 Tax=Variovorax sp. H27-G14 TaxID=3111914 RepID=UPI0038FBFAD5